MAPAKVVGVAMAVVGILVVAVLCGVCGGVGAGVGAGGGAGVGGATLALCALAVVAASRSLVPFQPSVASSPRSSVSRGGDTIPPAKGALDHVMGSCDASTCLYCHAR